MTDMNQSSQDRQLVCRQTRHDTLAAAASGRRLPLTPALSLREKENHRARVPEVGTSGDGERLAWCLPLPKGEGRGEGEQAAAYPEPPDATNPPCRRH